MNVLQKDRARTEIARKVRALREARRFTQGEISKGIGLSQGRFSEIERGQGSFTAEQFLELLKVFNVPVSHFSAEQKDPGSEIQNALARLGATHLHERAGILPSERFERAGDVVREVLVGADSPRHLTSLAPVLVRNIDRISLNKLQAQFLELGLEGRLGWLIENTLVAVRQGLKEALPRKQNTLYRRAELILGAHLAHIQSSGSEGGGRGVPDILDAQILSEKTLNEVQKTSSAISQRWGIATSLQPDDFLEALKASRIAD